MASDDEAPTASLAAVVPAAEASPAAALRGDELERSRVFFRIVLGVTVSGIAAALVTDGDALAKRVLLVASSGALLGTLYVLGFALAPASYRPRRLVLPGVLLVLGALSGVYYWGTISPVTGVLVYGIYFFSLGEDDRFIIASYTSISASHAALFVLTLTGVLEDHGLVRVVELSPGDRVVLLLMVEVFYLIAFLTARLSHQATLRAFHRLEHAVRAVAHRDALLAEARQELERVRDIGGAGKYTDQIVASYRLGAVIGRGGIGEVYAAEHVASREAAAVKLLRADALGDAVQVQRLLREAEATAQIDGAHVVRVFDVGTTASGVPFIVMERMHGHDLAQELRARRRLELAEARAIVDDIATGLDAARAVGIVHRDLKPHNVFGAAGASARVWKILDFGVSKLGTTNTLTAGHVVGTPAYMSPEQARAEEVDHRADVYALAAIVYRAVTGYTAFAARDIATTLYEVVHRVPAQPSSLAQLPRDVDRVLAIGLAKARDDRFATAPELARWFAAAIDGGLSPAQRARADALIARAPWGSLVAPGAMVA